MTAAKLAEIAVFRGACQKMRELTPLVSLVKRRRIRSVLEIGTLKGGTLWLWCQLTAPDGTIVSVDLPGGEFGGGYAEDDIGRLRAHAKPGQSLHLIRGDSHLPRTLGEVTAALSGRSLDLLFLDGDHRYAGVKQDFEMYAPLVRQGGLIVMHDILPHPRVPVCGVHRFWNATKRHYRHREFSEAHDDRGWGQWGGLGVITYTPQRLTSS
ncbi:MAG: class I SAM-dependent methyltransferase [Acidobacteria bacterium]|nr:class I SAM-dependent methyltransferase [Acidobacteriota bacterium]